MPTTNDQTVVIRDVITEHGRMLVVDDPYLTAVEFPANEYRSEEWLIVAQFGLAPAAVRNEADARARSQLRHKTSPGGCTLPAMRKVVVACIAPIVLMFAVAPAVINGGPMPTDPRTGLPAAPHTQTSGGTGQPQLPSAGLPQGRNYAPGAALPPDTPVPPGFEIKDGKLQKAKES